jgi:phosphate-selective porin OprO/OprP
MAMWRFLKRARFRWMPKAVLGWLLADWPAGALAQEAARLAPPVLAPPQAVAQASGGSQEFLDRLRALEQRLDRVTKQNEDLWRANKALAERLENPAGEIINPARYGVPAADLDGAAAPGVTAGREDGTAVPGSEGAAPMLGEPQDMGGEPAGTSGGGSDRISPPTAGGGSKRAGGDPTTTERAQGVGNRHLGKLSLKTFYDGTNDGFLWTTDDEEYALHINAMTQLDAMLYRQPTPGVTSSGFYNPRSRVYFEGHFTKPISYEFSFQNFYDTVALLDAYVNLNYDPRFQIRLGRYKNPFSYEFYRIHIWDLLTPERSLFANNFEANRRFGLMAHGVVLDQLLEYAVGGFDTQRNSLRPFNHRLDFQAFLNFKPFNNREEGFLLRDLQLGGSVDTGNENQPPAPAVLRTNQSPGPTAVNGTAASNAASVPFLAFNPAVLERGGRALGELHTAYYHGGLSLLGAWQFGHESYSNGPTGPRTRIPIRGWFVQGGYILTGETIRDRTLIDPLHPFDLRPGRFGLGAWELTARYSQLDLSSRIFTAGLADPTLWSNHAKLVDVGCNWYLNRFVKVYIDWEHAIFGSPVFSSTGSPQKSSDLFWLRTQVYF